MAKAVKLADIAEQVGVSTVTVSKALSGQKGVSEEMREKIKNLAEELGYRSPSETKRQSAEKQYNIGVLIQEVYLDKYDSFYWKMYQEVNKKAVSRGCFTLLESISRESVLENQMPLLLQEKKVDGLIILGDMTKPYIEQIEKEGGVPVVCLDFYNDAVGLDTVISNSFYGTYALTNYLFSMGHKKIAHINHGYGRVGLYLSRECMWMLPRARMFQVCKKCLFYTTTEIQAENVESIRKSRNEQASKSFYIPEFKLLGLIYDLGILPYPCFFFLYVRAILDHVLHI